VIYEEFAAMLAAFAAGQDLLVKYPGISFAPPDTGIWLELVLTRNGNIEYGIADDGPAPEQGLFRVLVIDRPGNSITIAYRIAKALAQAIPKGTPLDDAFVYKKPGITGPLEDAGWIMHPVTWMYQST
jgi:hypothetical protein